MGVAIPADQRVKIIESEKPGKYQNTVRELTKQWNRKVKIVPIIVGSLGTTKKKSREKKSKEQ